MSLLPPDGTPFGDARRGEQIRWTTRRGPCQGRSIAAGVASDCSLSKPPAGSNTASVEPQSSQWTVLQRLEVGLRLLVVFGSADVEPVAMVLVVRHSHARLQ